MSTPMPADPTANEADRPSELKRTPLEEEHLRLGAKMAPFAGWQMPIEYEGALAEHRSVRTHVGLFDLTHLGKVEVVGPGALGMLQRFVTNDLSKAGVGEALYNLVLNAGGGVIEDLIVYRLGEERFFVVPNAANAPRVLRMLEEERADGPLHLMYHQDWCFLAVQGPESMRVMAGLFPEATELAFMRCYEAEYRRRPVIVTRSGYTGEVGFELFTYQDIARELWSELLESVRSFDGGPAGLAARDVLRLEMGYPLYGQDLFEASTAFEAGLGWAVAMDK
ncbi:MAG TPA: glycine cleavage system aminomethyltransferase GcvT, partial [Actinomycetota bacterium]|nr:glycine cleavage system aminomethyltransferase GcvT [Actinomycetota bacterium]